MTIQEEKPKAQKIVYGNGIHAGKFNPKTGKFGEVKPQFGPKTVEQVMQLATQTQIDKDRLFSLMKNRKEKKKGTFGFPPNVNEQDLSQTGWGLVFPAAMPQNRVKDILEALDPLIQQRKKLTGENLFRVLSGPDEGVRPDDTAEAYLRRFKLSPGAKILTKVPGYLVLVGDPDEIPFRVQYQLDVDYYVGRLYFNPDKKDPSLDLQQYWQYANNVVQVEDGKVKLARTLRFFRPDNNGDPATSQSATDLVGTLVETLPQANKDWDITALDPKDSTRDRLQQLMGGAGSPTILFTASHGMVLHSGNKYQHDLQGALLCQDWQGVGDDLTLNKLMAADNLLPNANMLGSMAFLFACYGAGTPRYDNFIDPEFGEPTEIAPKPFLAALPQKLLSRGALAVMGHVDRAWTYSFQWEEAGPQIQHFEWTLTRLMNQNRVGYSLDYFNDRYSVIATDLVEILDKSEYKKPNAYDLVRLWTANNDARDYILVGDPACQLSLAAGNQQPERPTFTVSTFRSGKKPARVKAETPMGVETQKSETLAQGPEKTQPSKDFTTTDGMRSTSGAYAIQIHAEPDGTVNVEIVPFGGAAPAGRQAFAAPGAQDFGIRDLIQGGKEKAEAIQEKLDEATEALSTNLGKALKTLGANIQAFTEDVASLQIDTYTSRNLAKTIYDNKEKKFTNAELRAQTRLLLDGDAVNLVPLSSSGVDKDLWEIHLKMVEIAQANRTEMMKAIAEMITKLIPGPGG